MVAGCLLLGSCLSDSNSDNTVRSGNCAINTVTLGTLTRTIYTTRSDGVDTSYQVAVAGAAYPMYIDQLNQEIYNPDSLPIYTNPRKVLFTAITGDGTIAYRTPYGNDTLYNARDTIDMSEPVLFTCYSSDGNQQKTYRMTLNVHKAASEAFTWEKVSEAGEVFSGVTAQKAFALDSDIVVIALRNGQPALLRCAQNTPSQWSAAPLTGLDGADVSAIQILGGKLFAISSAGVMYSQDGALWQSTGATFKPERLVGAGANELYAVKDGSIYSSPDGITWAKDSADSDLSLFPATRTASAWIQMSFNRNFSYVLIGGLAQEDGAGNGVPVVWKKTVDQSGSNTEPWTLYAQDENNRNVYPAGKGSVMFNYDEKIYALSLQGDTLSNFYICSDAGRNWVEQERSTYRHPYSLKAESFGVVADGDNYVWITLAPQGDVWRGRLNRLSFQSHQTVFTKGARAANSIERR